MKLNHIQAYSIRTYKHTHTHQHMLDKWSSKNSNCFDKRMKNLGIFGGAGEKVTEKDVLKVNSNFLH